jgi:hypothetical protein
MPVNKSLTIAVNPCSAEATRRRARFSNNYLKNNGKYSGLILRYEKLSVLQAGLRQPATGDVS